MLGRFEHGRCRNRHVGESRLQGVETSDRLLALHPQKLTTQLVVGDLRYVDGGAPKYQLLQPRLAFTRLARLRRVDQHAEDARVENDELAQGKNGRLDS